MHCNHLPSPALCNASKFLVLASGKNCSGPAPVQAQWLKSSEQHGKDKHRRGSFGYAQDRLFDSAPQALCHVIDL